MGGSSTILPGYKIGLRKNFRRFSILFCHVELKNHAENNRYGMEWILAIFGAVL